MSQILKHFKSGAHDIGVLAVPPPHLLFLSSQVQAETGKSHLDDLAYVGGMVALVVREIDGEAIEMPKRLPQDLPGLAALGRGFVMAAYDLLDGYEGVMAAFAGAMSVYKEGESINPT